MRIFIQIPCFNEEENIANTLSDVRMVIDANNLDAEILVINDGSTDNTASIIDKMKVNHVIRLEKNKGLANAFSIGLDYALTNGAQIIVNTDADGQYPAEAIPLLVNEIRSGRADVVVADRETGNSEDFSFIKRLLQRLGSWTVSRLCGFKVQDAASGFRAYSRNAAAWIQITSKYTYTLESLVQLSQGNFRISNVTTGRKSVSRPSRLFKSTSEYVLKNGFTLLRVWVQYNPMRFFTVLSSLLTLVGVLLGLPFLYAKFSGSSGQHIQLTVFSAAMLGLALLMLMLGFLGDGIRANRILIQRSLQKLRLM